MKIQPHKDARFRQPGLHRERQKSRLEALNLKPIGHQAIAQTEVREYLQVRVVVEVLRRAILEIGLDDREPSARAEHPADLRQRRGQFVTGQVLEEIACEDDIDRLVLEHGQRRTRSDMRHHAGRNPLRKVRRQIEGVPRAAMNLIDEMAVARPDLQYDPTVWNLARLKVAAHLAPHNVASRVVAEAGCKVSRMIFRFGAVHFVSP